MFPTPIEKTSRSWQLTYQALLPLALIIWLLPLIAVAVFSIKPLSDFSQATTGACPRRSRGSTTTARCFSKATCPVICGIP